MRKKTSTPYDSRVVSKQKQSKNLTPRISPQFNQFYQQKSVVPSKRPSLIHPSLIQNQTQNKVDETFDRFVLSTTNQDRKRQSRRQDKDLRNKVKICNHYPYNCYGKVKATYKKEMPINQKPIVKNHKIIQNKQYIETYTWGIAAFIGQGLMVTAAHVVPNEIQGKNLVKIEVYFQYSTYRLQVQKVLIHPQYQCQRQNNVSHFDMAVLVMKPHNKFQYPSRYLSIQWDYSPKDYPDKQLKFLTFYESTQSNIKLMQANHLEIEHRDQCMILYKNTTIEGDSGSSILMWNSMQGEYKVVGIHIGDYGKANYGLLLTSKSYSPKDIFSQMIEHHISLQSSQQLEKNSISLKNTVRQQESSAIQIMGKLQVNQNYSLSTEKYIKFLQEENVKRKTQNELLKQINKELKEKNILLENNRISYPSKIIQTKISRELPKLKEKQSLYQTPKIKENKKQNKIADKIADKIPTKKKESLKSNVEQSKEVSIQDTIKQQPNNQTSQEQQNCLIAICKVFSNWLFHRPRAIANSDQESSARI